MEVNCRCPIQSTVLALDWRLRKPIKKFLNHKYMSRCQDSKPSNHRIRTKKYILWSIIDQPLCIAACWFGTNSEGVTRPLPTQHYATQTNGDLLFQLYLKYWSQFLTQARQVRGVTIIDKKKQIQLSILYSVSHIFIIWEYSIYITRKLLYKSV